MVNILEVNKKLIGEVEPIGETHTDNERYNNLKEMINLTESLIDEIILVARHKGCREFSINRSGELADKFIDKLKDDIDFKIAD